MVFSAALSGIQAASKELDVIGNNVSNSATAGFKESRAEFADVYASSALGTSANAVGGGVRLANISQSFNQGTINFTNNNLDLAVNGEGFFIMNNNGSTSYTRAGAFGLDREGFIVNSDNQRLVGLTADATGNITGLQGDLRIDNSNISPSASTSVTTGVNLFSNETPASIDWVGGSSPSVSSYNNVSSSTIYDSLGNSHVLSMYFIHGDATAGAGTPNATTPASTNNQWYVAFQIDNQNVPTLPATNNTDNLYRINFNSDGTFNSAAGPAGFPAVSQNRIPLSFTLTNGAEPLNLQVDLTNSTQFGSPFAVQSNIQNGFTTGRLDSVDVDTSGIIFGRYTNGQSKAMGQLQLANFSNNNGLQPLGNTSWAETFASGQPLISNPGTASLGLIQAGALEDSNVDLTSELVNLITAQRNFQANAQTIRTADTVTQTIINLR
jgi:flagellar hook protein FlgE